MASDREPRPSEQREPSDLGRGRGKDDAPPSLIPELSLPKGGGAIRDLGEKITPNPATGTSTMTVPVMVSGGRSGFGPRLSLSYESSTGNGIFGVGWSLDLPAISRKTAKGLPQYLDAEESDVFILSGAEDLVPELRGTNGDTERVSDPRTVGGVPYRVDRYRPRVEGLFARIERWTSEEGEVHWRSITRENITTVFGNSENSRIYDPQDEKRVFSWLVAESYDDKGNTSIYEYKREDSAGIDTAQAHERNRSPSSRSANLYPQNIFYGNRVSRLVDPDPAHADWMFQISFDYGEYDADSPAPGDAQPWRVRQDPFSSHQSGFEVRTYRLCRRILVFHHFPDEADVGADCLIRATELQYREGKRGSFVTSILQHGYRRTPGGWSKRTMPPLEFAYTEAKLGTEVRELDEESLEHLPIGLDGARYQFADLDGEGLSGILSESAGAWFYKPNRGGGRFGAQSLLALRPSLAVLSAGRQQLLDLAGDGRLDLVSFDGPTPGFYERTDEGWESFRAFASIPNLRFDDANLRFIDLDGDGSADLLLTQDEALVFYPSLGEDGFGPAQAHALAFEEEEGPKLVFSGDGESIFLADMSGDGLTDLVRIKNGEVAYWPNLGYGRFGAKVSMDGAPIFDVPERFSPKNLKLADVDGSGSTDLIYLTGSEARVYFNESGNSFAAPEVLSGFPQIDDLSSVSAVDLFGNGTACLVWSSPLAGHARRQMRYLDLMGEKPHLLREVKNNLGALTVLHHAPSTRFYLEDKAAGRPWITKLPFPVHVLERLESHDLIGGSRFMSRYRYHHGFFDGVEREFRGFGMVEQIDTEELSALSASDDFPTGENVDATSHVPPVLTKTWFHTGAFAGGNEISRLFADEYWREPGLTAAEVEARLLPDTILPSVKPGSHLLADEAREACRALRGSMLRQELYALDAGEGSSDAERERALRPYTVSECNHTLELLQPQGPNRHAVFHVEPRETIDAHYERNPADPRVQHAINLEIDRYGNVLRSAAIGYGRRQPDLLLAAADRAQQTQLFATTIEQDFTNAIDEEDDYRTPAPAESRTYELHNLQLPAGRVRFTFEELDDASKNAAAIAYEETPGPGARRKRLIEHKRSYYRKDDLSARLALKTLEPLAIPAESYELALTPGLINQVYGALVTNAMLANDARYVHSEGDTSWWRPSGQAFFSPNEADTTTQERDYARAHFFRACRGRDAFGHTAFVRYDKYDLLVEETRDRAGNRITAGERDAGGALIASGQDYRVLQPRLVMDPNRNRTAVVFDTLGLVTGTAVLGKPGAGEGDSLQGFDPDLTPAVIAAFLADPLADPPGPASFLGRATVRMIYDFDAPFRTRAAARPDPAVVCTLARETHDAELAAGATPKVQLSLSYSDGYGREIQKKLIAEPGPLSEGGAIQDPRWVGSGWMVLNNKGKPVRQYEPFFSATHAYEHARIAGVSKIIFYDPVERVVATLHPHHAYEKLVFDPWQSETWDLGDTVALDPKNDPHVAAHFRRLPDAEYLPTWRDARAGGALGADEKDAAEKSEAYAGTPSRAYLDTLARTFLSVAKNRFEQGGATVEETYETRTALDIEGNALEVRDALGRVVVRNRFDVRGTSIHRESMEGGARWSLQDVSGSWIYAWDSRANVLQMTFDDAHRPLEVRLTRGAEAERVVEKKVYGEGVAGAEALNLRGRIAESYDGAGVITNERYDFKGNLLQSKRRLAAAYQDVLDWSGAVPLEAKSYPASSSFDALNRPKSMSFADGSIVSFGYNEAGFLETLDANVRGAAVTHSVTGVEYDARGQRRSIGYGNGVTTRYDYDPRTFRLTRVFTTRGAAFGGDCPDPDTACGVQNLRYTYDVAGNVTRVRDRAQQSVFYKNRRVDPDNDYTYDAVFRLIEASGREHLGLAVAGVQPPPAPSSPTDAPLSAQIHPGDGDALGRYLERYSYDAAGNLETLEHAGSDPANPGWTRAYTYDEASTLEPAKQSNRLTKTKTGTGPDEPYTYDAHGSMTSMPHLPIMRWDHRDRLQASSKQIVVAPGVTPELSYYVYGAGGERARKVTERQAAAPAVPTRSAERIYLGSLEIYREYAGDGTTITLERQTLHLLDGRRRVALVESRVIGDDGSPARLDRHQHDNHLGSASLELDLNAEVISYEEYTPFGSTSYLAVRAGGVPIKRYRFLGKERDEESGLCAMGARYYAPWLGRWTSADPIGLEGGINLYAYALDNPVKLIDPTGTQASGVYDEEVGECRIDYPTCSPENPAGIMSPAPVRVAPARPHRPAQAPARPAPAPAATAVNPDITVTLTVRSYAPFETFGALVPYLGDYHGDNRGPSTNLNDTARVTQATTFTLGGAQVSNGAIDSPSAGYGVYPFAASLLSLNWFDASYNPIGSQQGQPLLNAGPVVSGTGVSESDSSVVRNGDGSVSVNQSYAGPNVLVNGAPDIDVHNSATITTTATPNGYAINLRGGLTGDAFPNAEVILSNPQGDAVQVHTFQTQRGPTFGPYLSLWGNGSSPMGTYDVTVRTDTSGRFRSVSGGSLGAPGSSAPPPPAPTADPLPVQQFNERAQGPPHPPQHTVGVIDQMLIDLERNIYNLYGAPY